MHNPSQGQPGDLLPALAVAVAVATSCSSAPDVSAELLVGDEDPLAVVAALATAWSTTLRVALGEAGRDIVLRAVGLAAAEQQAEQ